MYLVKVIIPSYYTTFLDVLHLEKHYIYLSSHNANHQQDSK
ncbi:hypothetical protein [Priestia megaterium]